MGIAKVENMVGIVERQVLAAIRDFTFTSVAEINAAVKPLVDKINIQSFQKMKISVTNCFPLNPPPFFGHFRA